MARIPLQVASRSLDTGGVVQYPTSTPVADALSRFGSTLQGVAERVKEKQQQKDAFDARIKEQEFSARLVGIEDEASRNASMDGSGLHDSVYGQLGPDGRPIRPGSFDQLFEEYAAQVPESKREEFRAKKEAFRLQGSTRLARAQYDHEQSYYKVQIEKTQDQITTAMAEADPNDDQTFEAFKKQGLDIINESGLPELEKEVARVNWLANADEALFKTKLAKDPEFAGKARAALGLAPAITTLDHTVDRIIGAESGGSATAKNPNSSAEGAGQFIDSTWLAMIRKHRPDIAAGRSASEILALKTNGALSREMTKAYAQENASYLATRGLQQTPGNIYLAHFLGPMGAVQVLKADPGASVASIVGQGVVKANPFLAGMSAADVRAWADKKMGQAPSGKADPRFANIPLDRRLVLANQADVELGERERMAAATMKAEYTSHKDAIELGIVQGNIRDEALIANDSLLTDGDKATLIRSFRTQNDTILQTRADLEALTAAALTLDPYASKDKTRADNLYTEAAKNLSAEQAGSIASEIIKQTGVVPQPVINAIRKGLTSQNPAEVAAAAQSASRISQVDSAALGRRDGGSEVQNAADDFGFYVNRLNLSPDEAAQRLIEKNDPNRRIDRKALEPAAKEFVKQIEKENLAGEFGGALGFGAPDLGFTPGQELGIMAEYAAIAEDAFYAVNGDPELAKNRAVEQMKRLYGVTQVTGRKVVMKHPPEKYWPASRITKYGNTSYVGDDPSLDYARMQLESDLKALYPDVDMDRVQIVTTPETDQMVKRGEMPGYAVVYTDENGVMQTIPGQMWRPDINAAREREAPIVEREELETLERARSRQEVERQEAERATILEQKRIETGDMLRGGPIQPPPQQEGQPTLRDRIDERQDRLFENAPEAMP